MVLRQYEDRVRCLSDRLRSCADISHHRSAYKVDRVRCRHMACKRDHLIQRRPDRHAYSHRMLNFRYDRHQLVFHRCLLVQCPVYIVYSLYIEHRDAAKEADIGIAGGIGEGLLIKKGEIVKKVKEEELLETLRQELLNWER